MIAKTFLNITEDISRTFYEVFVMLHLDFANQTWNPQLKKDYGPAEFVQRRTDRKIPSPREMNDPE